MPTVTLSKKEYERLKHFSAAYLKIAEEIISADRTYPYDYKFIRNLIRQARGDYKRDRFIEAESVDKALTKFNKK